MAQAQLGGKISAGASGSYGFDAFSGAFVSLAGNLTGSMLSGVSNKYVQFGVSTVMGGFSGGVSSEIAGGNFWDGARNGMISAGLNHGLHMAKNEINKIHSMKQFIKAYKGHSLDQINNSRGINFSETSLNSQPGGPNLRYVVNPHDGKVLDMRHMLIVGKYPVVVGNVIEFTQWLTGDNSGMKAQDFYSNGVGYQFFQQYNSVQNFLQPNTFSDQLNDYFFNPKKSYSW